MKKRHIQEIKRIHEVDIRDKEEMVKGKDSEINRLSEFLDAYNGVLTDEVKKKEEEREEYFNRPLIIESPEERNIRIHISLM
jgi:hypothetical protein